MLGFFKYTDFFLENFNAFSQIAHLDFNIPLPHILLPLALSFVTFQQIAFLYDCYKRTKGELKENLNMDFIDYALFISFFPQLIAGPIVHHREMMPQFAKMGNTGNSSLSMQCDKILDFSKCTDDKSANIFKNPKSLHSHTANTKIVESTNSSLREARSDSWQSTSDSRGSIFDEKSGLRSCERGNRTDSSLTKRTTSLPDLSQKAEFTNYELLAKGIFIFSIGLFKKTFIADSFAKWANAGFSVVEKGEFLNIAESWATSLSYTFQLYFDFSGYCDMAIGLGLMFGIMLPLNFNSPYKSLNITEFWRRWHITLGRFLTECVYIPLGGNRVGKILNLRNIFIVFFLSGIWHGAGWGFVIWGILHGIAMVIHRVYAWCLGSIANHNNSSLREAQSTMSQKRIDESHKFTQSKKIISNSQVANVDCFGDKSPRNDEKMERFSKSHNDELFLRFTQTRFYKFLCWLLTFNFINLAWVFFRAENLQGAVNLLKGMFGVVWIDLPQKWHIMPETLAQIAGRNDTIFYIIIALGVCLACKNSFEMLKDFDTQYLRFRFSLRIFSKKIYLKGGAVFTRFVLTITLFYIAIWAMLSNLLDSNTYTPFLYFNF